MHVPPGHVAQQEQVRPVQIPRYLHRLYLVPRARRHLASQAPRQTPWPGLTQKTIRKSGITKKWRGSLYQLHVPLLKALALPNPVRTSNAEAHADMPIPPPSHSASHGQGTRRHKTHPTRHLPLPCLRPDFLELARFRAVKRTKRPSKRLSMYTAPMHPTASDEASAMGNLGKYTKKCAKEPHPSIKNRTHSRHSGTRQADSPFLPTTGRPIGKCQNVNPDARESRICDRPAKQAETRDSRALEGIHPDRETAVCATK